MRDRAAHDGGMEHAVSAKVGHERPFAAQQAGIFQPLDRRADEGVRSRHSEASRQYAERASSTASMMGR